MCRLSLNKSVSISARKATVYLNHHLSHLNISSGEFFYIICACDHEGVSQEQLGKLVGINKSTTTKVLTKLEKEGYINRMQDDRDKRVYKVYPTEKARAIYPEILGVLDDWNRLLVKGLTEEEVDMLLTLMEKVEQNALHYDK